MPGIAGPPTVPPQPPHDMVEDQFDKESPRHQRRRASPVQPPMTAHEWRIVASFAVGFIPGLLVALAKGLTLLQAGGRGMVFALLVGLIVWVLSWTSETAVQKGYSGWLGLLLVAVLNVVGILVLLWLPPRSAQITQGNTG